MKEKNTQLLNKLINEAKKLDALLLKAKKQKIYLTTWTTDTKIYIELKERIKS